MEELDREGLGEGGPTNDSIELFRQAQAGDAAAYERIFERYYPRVLSIVRHRLGERLRGKVESGDILNEAMIGAIQRFDDFDVPNQKALVGLFARLVENRIRNEARRQGARKRDPELEVALAHIQASIASGAIQLEPRAEGPAVLDELVQREEAALMRACFARLDPRKQRVIREGLDQSRTWEEKARALGRPSADAVRMEYVRAVEELRAAVRGHPR